MAYIAGIALPEIAALKQRLRDLFKKMGFRERTAEEAIDSIQTVPKQFRPGYKKFFAGIGLTWIYNDRDAAWAAQRSFARKYALIVTAHSGLHLFGWFFIVGRRAWRLVIHEINPMFPLFLPPMNKSDNFEEVFSSGVRLCKEIAIHLPCCPGCGEKYFWRIVPTKSPRDEYIHFDDRELYCAYPSCINYKQGTGILIGDISLGTKKDTAALAKVFTSARERRRKYWDENDGTVPTPSRWTRYWTKLGFTFPRDYSPYANDTAVEKMLELKKASPYSDLQYEHENPYPNG